MKYQTACMSRTHLALRMSARAPRLTLLQAPAGYGKSALLDQWHGDAKVQGRRVVRLNLEPCHGEPQRLMADLVMASRNSGAAAPSRCRDAQEWLSELSLASQGTLVLLDGLEKLRDGGAGLQALLADADGPLHLVLAGRTRPALPLARLYACGAVQEIGVQQLRFTRAEVSTYLADIGVVLADASALERIVELTEGWPAGLRLLGDTLRELPAHTDIKVAVAAAWRRIASYFDEQVLADAPAQVCDFLLRTAPLRQLSAALCEAVTGDADARELLEVCERHSLFVHRLPERANEFYRHRLFCEYLRAEFRKLPRREQQRLHGRASERLRDQGSFEEAFEHAIAADEPERAAGILDACGDSRCGMLGPRLLALAARLPASLLERHPRTLLATTWQAIFSWEFDRAYELMRVCRGVLDQLEHSEELPASELAEFEHLYLHQQMMLAFFENDMPRVQRLCERLIQEYVSATPWIKASLLISLIQANTEQYRLRDAESLAARARKLLERSEHPLPLIPLAAAIAQVRLIGSLDQNSIEELTGELHKAMGSAWSGAAAAASMLAVPLAEMHYERNDTARARELLDRHLSPVPSFGFLDLWLSGSLLRSRLLQLAGDQAGGLEALQIKRAWAPEGGLKRLRDFLAADRIRLLLREGNVPEAVRVARESGALGPPAHMMPDRSGADASREVRATAFVRLALARRRFDEALRVCARWRTYLEGAGAIRGVVRWGALTASALLLGGQQRAAQRALRQAIIAAAPGGYLRSILDEGPDIGRLLLDHPQLATDLPAPLGEFGRTLLAAFEQELCRERNAAVRGATRAQPGLPEAHLSPREIEMLRMVAAGLMNREVAERLAMTEGSVKWYLYHLYRKLGVSRRTRAVFRARELGFVR